MTARGPLLYLPAKVLAPYLAVGHRSTAADLGYLWAIQYFGATGDDRKERVTWTYKVYVRITDFDPHFRDAYWLGFVSLLMEARSPRKAFELADKGLRNEPQFTWMAIEAAIEAKRLRCPDLMLRYLKIGSETGDLMAKRFMVTLETVDTAQQELAAWAPLLDENDELTRAIAQTHVRDLRVLIDVTTLEALLRCHSRTRGLPARSLEDLAKAGLVSELPHDPEGAPYVLDVRTGSVRSVTPYRHSPPSRSRLGVDLTSLGPCAPPDGHVNPVTAPSAAAPVSASSTPCEDFAPAPERADE